LTKLANSGVSSGEIRCWQAFAGKLNERLSQAVAMDAWLSLNVHLIIWHGSLPKGEGGDKYDIDYAVFMNAYGARELMDSSREFATKVAERLREVAWRNDLHYDGMDMFEAHTHWDLCGTDLPSVGVHLYQKTAINEVVGKQSWRSAQETSACFFRELMSWRRFCFFMRHWVYEGVPVYDPKRVFKEMSSLEHRMPDWMRERLREAIQCAILGYTKSKKGMCTVKESKGILLDMIAMLAYSSEDRPIGRVERYKSDAGSFLSPTGRRLLHAVMREDLPCAVSSLQAGT